MQSNPGGAMPFPAGEAHTIKSVNLYGQKSIHYATTYNYGRN